MTISEYIEFLQQLKTEHGDLEVEQYDFSFNRVSAPAPKITHRRILKPRQRKESFWYFYEPCRVHDNTNKSLIWTYGPTQGEAFSNLLQDLYERGR